MGSSYGCSPLESNTCSENNCSPRSDNYEHPFVMVEVTPNNPSTQRNPHGLSSSPHTPSFPPSSHQGAPFAPGAFAGAHSVAQGVGGYLSQQAFGGNGRHCLGRGTGLWSPVGHASRGRIGQQLGCQCTTLCHCTTRRHVVGNCPSCCTRRQHRRARRTTCCAQW